MLLSLNSLDSAPKLSIQYDWQGEEVEEIHKGLAEANDPYLGYKRDVDFALTIKDEKGSVVAGLLAWMRPGMGLLYIDTLWVSETLRHQGYGTQLLLAAEEEGRKQGCTHSQVETTSFQAEGFYEKLGYSRIGVVEKWFKDYDYIFMRKSL